MKQSQSRQREYYKDRRYLWSVLKKGKGRRHIGLAAPTGINGHVNVAWHLIRARDVLGSELFLKLSYFGNHTWCSGEDCGETGEIVGEVEECKEQG